MYSFVCTKSTPSLNLIPPGASILYAYGLMKSTRASCPFQSQMLS
jgi:hypothetical protein